MAVVASWVVCWAKIGPEAGENVCTLNPIKKGSHTGRNILSDIIFNIKNYSSVYIFNLKSQKLSLFKRKGFKYYVICLKIIWY